MPAKKKSSVADALTADKPRAARVMDVIAAPPSAILDLSAPLTDDIAVIENKDVETITAEVIQLQQMGNRCLLEIGKRLIAAKEKLSHGDWLPFLERVNISPRFAQRYMRLAREWTNATSLSYLGMSKALALLALPDPDERDAFIAETHVIDGEIKTADEMSVRELEAAIKARQDAETAAKIAESKVSVLEARLKESERDAEAQLYEAQRRLRESDAENDKVRGELTLAQNRAAIAENAKAEALAERDAEREKRFAVADELEKLKNKPTDVAIEKVADEAAIEAARKEVREQMQSDLDFARADADTARKALEATKESAQKAIDKANADAKQAASDAENARQELARVKANAKATQFPDNKESEFLFFFQQAKDLINRMAVTLANIQNKNHKSAFQQSLLALADAVRKAAE